MFYLQVPRHRFQLRSVGVTFFLYLQSVFVYCDDIRVLCLWCLYCDCTHISRSVFVPFHMLTNPCLCYDGLPVNPCLCYDGLPPVGLCLCFVNMPVNPCSCHGGLWVSPCLRYSGIWMSVQFCDLMVCACQSVSVLRSCVHFSPCLWCDAMFTLVYVGNGMCMSVHVCAMMVCAWRPMFVLWWCVRVSPCLCYNGMCISVHVCAMMVCACRSVSVHWCCVHISPCWSSIRVSFTPFLYALWHAY